MSGDPGSRNRVEGNHHGNIVQARAIHGDVHFHHVPTADVPHQVPLAPVRFVNRSAELAAGGGALGAGEGRGSRITVLTGLPGAGKSALARRLVELNRGAYPGGELYVDFGAVAVADHQEAVGDALGSCLLALGVSPQLVPASLADRTGLFRSKTAASPVLVVLDDVAEPGQVPAFRPQAPGSAVLVTSNAQLTELRLDGADVVEVGPLDEAAGTHMLRELCGTRAAVGEPDLAALVRECGGLPVALRVAAARLVGRRSLTVRALVEEIADTRRGAGAFRVNGEDKVSAVFAVAYRKLPGDAARLYRLLGASPVADFTVELAAAVLDIDEGGCADLVDVVVEAGLLQEVTGGRHRFHGLVRRHAASEAAADPAELAAGVRRAVGFLLVSAAFGDLAILGPGRYRCTPHDQVLTGREDPFSGDKAAALEWMDVERPNLAAGVRTALEQGWYDQAWQLAESATALYANRRYLVDWTETSELGSRAARLAGNAEAEARLRSFASRAWIDLGDTARARAELDQAFPLLAGTEDTRLVASVHEMDGRHHEAVGDHARALAAFQRSLDLFTSMDDLRGAASLTYFIGCARFALGDLADAQATLGRAAELLREVPDSKMEGRALITIGRVREALGDDDQAGAAFGRAVDVLVAGNDLFHESWAREAAANLAERRGDVEAARLHVTRMVEIQVRLGGGRVDELTARLAALG